MKRFAVIATPYNFGNPTRRLAFADARMGDVLEVTEGAKPDNDGDYYGRIQRTGRATFINRNCLEEVRPTPAPAPVEKVAVDAVKKAAKVLGLEADAVKVLVSAAKAIEAGI